MKSTPTQWSWAMLALALIGYVAMPPAAIATALWSASCEACNTDSRQQRIKKGAAYRLKWFLIALIAFTIIDWFSIKAL